jgi:hypothetical protein
LDFESHEPTSRKTGESSAMIGRLFRLPPIVYFILAPLVLALGVAGMISSNSNDAEKAAALSHAAPEPVALQDVTSGDTGNDYKRPATQAMTTMKLSYLPKLMSTTR